MGTGTSIIMSCAAMRIVQQTAKVADASDSLYSMIKELDEAIADSGGLCGQQLSEIQGVALRMQNSICNALYIMPLEEIAGHLNNTSHAAFEEVLGNIRAARLRRALGENAKEARIV